MSNLVLRLPDFSKPFVAHSDASSVALGVFLSHDYSGDLMPVIFASRLLNNHKLYYSTIEIECV